MQRFGIALVLIHNPKLMILDEPMNGLNPVGIGGSVDEELTAVSYLVYGKNQLCIFHCFFCLKAEIIDKNKPFKVKP